MSWEPVDLLAIEDEPLAPPEWGGLIYRALRHLLSGEPESMKTLAAMILALEVIRAGGHVIYADFEMGAGQFKARMRDLGGTDRDLTAISYVEPDAAPTSSELQALIRDNTDAAIIDAASGAFDVADLDDTRTRDAERFARVYLRTFWKAGVATIVIDHVVKNRANRGKYASGNHRKVGGVDVHLSFEVDKPLTRGGTGQASALTKKDRNGHLARPKALTLNVVSHPDTHALTWTWSPPSSSTETDNGWRPTRLMEKVSRYLEQHGPANRTAIYGAVSGKRPFLVTAVQFLIEDGYAQETVPGRKGTTISLHKPFREEPFPGSPTVPDGSQERRALTVPTVPAPTGAGGNGNDHDEDELERLHAIAKAEGLA